MAKDEETAVTARSDKGGAEKDNNDRDQEGEIIKPPIAIKPSSILPLNYNIYTMC